MKQYRIEVSDAGSGTVTPIEGAAKRKPVEFVTWVHGLAIVDSLIAQGYEPVDGETNGIESLMRATVVAEAIRRESHGGDLVTEG